MTHDKTTGLDPNVLGAESYAEALGSLDKLHSYVMCSVSWAHDDGSQFNEVCSLFNTIRAALQSQLTKNDENVTCGNLSNADGRQAALESIDRLDGWLSELKGMIEAPQELLLINRPSILADINCAIKDMRVNGACIRAALQSPRVPVIEILETVLEQAEDDGLWFNAKYASEGYLQQELRRLHAVIERAYAELQKGN